MVGRCRPRLEAMTMNMRLEMRALGIRERKAKAKARVRSTVRDLVNIAENCLTFSSTTSGTTKS